MYKLRELEKKDLPEINQWRNNPKLISFLGSPYRFINLYVDEKWFESYMENRANTVRCAIVDDTKDEILGLVSLISIDHINQTAEFHIMIGNSSNQGKGIGSYALNAMLHHAFFNINLRRIELTVLEDNVKACHLYEKEGFVREGVKRKARYKNGEWVNMVLYSILKEEYYPKS